MVKISMKKKVQQVTFRFFLDLMMWKIATTSMSVFRNLDCLSLAVCSNTTLLKVQNVLFFFFPNSALRNRGCGISMDAAYTDVYGTSWCTSHRTCHACFNSIMHKPVGYDDSCRTDNTNTPWDGLHRMVQSGSVPRGPTSTLSGS